MIVGEKSCENDLTKQILLFYFLIKKYLNWLDCSKTKVKDNQAQVDHGIIHNIQLEQAKIARSDAPNRFDKQEFFEIQLFDEEDEELFQAAELAIPVSSKFLDLKNINFLEKQTQDLCGSENNSKPYFFLPGFVDLSFWCPKIEDQGSLNSCTAFAGISLFEYFVNRSSGQYEDVSPLFLYKAARQLMKIEGDGGASVRDTMKAMALFGIPPEDSWPYLVENCDKEPPSFCYVYAQNYQALKYFRLDYAGIPKDILLFEIKAILTAGFPCMFGFTLYSSAFEDSNPQKGNIPFPDENKDKIVDGHAVVAVGYDDHKILKHANPEELPTRGAILIRNSWGVDWGNQGYGWLPYDYVLEGLTSAWWSLLKAEWFKGDDFGLGGKGGNDTDHTCQKGQSGCPT
ncbi:MAG: C1 family peptidase [Symploca sp. SIO2B6]|nr:C1 family peptidase [Symploca sp. SIO2B6]